MIWAGFGLISALIRLDSGLDFSLSLAFTRMFAYSSLSEALIALQEVPGTCYEVLGLATAEWTSYLL